MDVNYFYAKEIRRLVAMAPEMNKTDRWIMVAMMLHATGEGKVTMTRRHLSAFTGFSMDTVKKRLSALRAAGFISYPERDEWGYNFWRITFDSIPSIEDAMRLLASLKKEFSPEDRIRIAQQETERLNASREFDTIPASTGYSPSGTGDGAGGDNF
jgi:transcription initiation factor IIE alpha subunit